MSKVNYASVGFTIGSKMIYFVVRPLKDMVNLLIPIVKESVDVAFCKSLKDKCLSSYEEIITHFHFMHVTLHSSSSVKILRDSLLGNLNK